MQFYSTLAAVAALVSMVSAQQYTQNPLHAPMGGEVIPAGKEYIIKWTPTTEGRVDLLLKKGKSDDLDTADVITDGLPNAGLFYWTPDADLEPGSDYAIEIKNAAGDINYTGQFTISNDGSGEDKPEEPKEEDEEDKEEEQEHDKTTDASYPTTTLATSTIAGNTTTTPTGNSTKLPTRTPTAKPSTTDDEEAPENTDAPEDDEDTSAAAGVHSSLALVVCVLGAVLYLH